MEVIFIEKTSVTATPVLCACGCGRETPTAKRTEPSRGYVQGQPQRFLPGHHAPRAKPTEPPVCCAPGCIKPARGTGKTYCPMHASRLFRHGSLDDPRPSAADRFFKKVIQDGECWRWTGPIMHQGYGHFSFNNGPVRAHRWAYELLRGEIPPGLQLDHLCRNRACVNPWHLEPVTPRVNTLRSSSHIAFQAASSSCPNGHEYTPENLHIDPRGGRVCRTCRRRKDAKRRATLREKS